MPSARLTTEERIVELDYQFNSFLNSKELKRVFQLLDIFGDTISQQCENLKKEYDIRGNYERQAISLEDRKRGIEEKLAPVKEELFSVFDELGLISINKPIFDAYNHILILGGSYMACFDRTHAGSKYLSPSTVSVVAPTCYRMIDPKERRDKRLSDKETEFGVLTDAFISVFGLKEYEDCYKGNINTNEIECVRKFASLSKTEFIVYAAPSREKNRRADSMDTYNYFFDKATFIEEDDNALLVTNNIYCNYQFIPFAIAVLERRLPLNFDIVGCSDDDSLTNAKEYDLVSHIGELISIMDWIYFFKNKFKLKLPT